MNLGDGSAETLRSEFCPPIDEALFWAITSDYDLTHHHQLEQCRQQLAVLKEETLQIDSASFDQAGAGFLAPLDSHSASHRSTSSTAGSDATGDAVSRSDDPLADSQCLHDSSQAARATELAEIFPHIPQAEITARLRKSDGNFTRTIDQLLNFDLIPKSIDGFEYLPRPNPSRLPRGRRRTTRRPDPSRLSHDASIEPTRSVWSSTAPHQQTTTAGLEIIRRYPAIDLDPTPEKPPPSSSWQPVHPPKGRGRSNPDDSAMSTRGSLPIGQPSASLIDLHGCTVQEAVLLTREAVHAWWQGLGDAKYAGGGGGPVREGYRVVTGVGHHSKNGVPKIRPAVVRALVRDGWKIRDDQRGEILVTGRARRS